jgi:hypothetical protein
MVIIRVCFIILSHIFQDIILSGTSKPGDVMAVNFLHMVDYD